MTVGELIAQLSEQNPDLSVKVAVYDYDSMDIPRRYAADLGGFQRVLAIEGQPCTPFTPFIELHS